MSRSQRRTAIFRVRSGHLRRWKFHANKKLRRRNRVALRTGDHPFVVLDEVADPWWNPRDGTRVPHDRVAPPFARPWRGKC